MSEQTKIEWADSSWNPWIGCAKVSPGCVHCYAEVETFTRAQRAQGRELWGRGAQRHRTSEAYWKKPLLWNRAPRLAPGTPRPRVFPSMCDWLDNEVPVEWLADFIGLIMSTPNLDWMLLTKRPENFFNRLTAVNCSPGFGLIDRAKRVGGERIAMLATWVEFWRTGSAAPHNVWIGTSVEDQQRADERIPELLQIQARVRFLSVEPLLGPVDLEMALEDFQPLNADLTRKPSPVQWVIVGGESGPKARPCNIAWVRDIVRQCAAAGVPCFVKQLGSFCIEEEGSQRRRILWDHPKGGDPDEWPEDLRVRQFPESQEGGGK